MDTDPLILTLTLDAASQAWFEARRRTHFPAARNFLAAHLTLFHALPAAEAPEILTVLAAEAAARPPLALAVERVLFLGAGVAYALESTELRALHRQLQSRWQPHLTPQDRQPLRPHVTVQNKVPPAAARALHGQLTAEFLPFAATGTGLHLWTYRGGPWESRAGWPFGGAG